MIADKPTRVAVDLLESAAVEGVRQSRSAKQQLDHWARVGRAVSMRETASRMRIEAVLGATMTLAQLTTEERVVANAELDASIQERARSISFGARLAAQGITTVSLDDDGNLIEHRPDGTRVPIG